MASAARAPDRDLRAMLGDGIAFSVMVGLGETYLPAFVLAAGFGEVAAGLVATLPMLAGAALQLATPWGVRRLHSYRRWVVLCARLQAASFLPLVAGVALGRVDLGLVFGAATAYWGFGMSTGPAWNTWVSTLVPAPLRAPFFARRGRFSQAALLAGVAAGGLWLHGLPDSLHAFAVLFALAALARLISARFLARQSEPEPPRHDTLELGPRLFADAVRRRPEGRVLHYLLAMQVAVNVGAPFFTPYLLGPLGLPYGTFMAYTAAAFLSRIAAFPWLGALALRFGTGPMLWLGALGITPLPGLWLLAEGPIAFVTLQLFAGAAWAAVELATLLAFFEHLEPRARTSVLTYFNLANALAIAAGALLGSLCFGPGGYALVFGLSLAARAASLLLLRGVPSTQPAPQLPEVRTLAVRPNAGGVQRPILATLPDEGAE
jgi:MFS family permease